MHVVHLSTRMNFYGGEVCLANLSCGLVGKGHRVSCLTRPRSALAAHLGQTQVEVAQLKMIDWYDPGTIRRVRDWLKRHPTDILASHTPRDYFIAAVASRGLKVCNVATRHQLKPLSWPVLKRPFLRNFGAVISVSEAVAAGVLAGRWLPAQRTSTVLNGIEDPLADAKLGLRERLGLPPEAPLVGLIGKLCAAKGGEGLLQAAALAARQGAASNVVFIGDGDPRYLAHLRSLVDELGLANDVHFLPYLPRVAQAFSELDVVVVPSVAEPFGLVTVEAMASGVPVIGTNAGGTPEIFTDGREGFLVRPHAVGDLANRLQCLIASPGLRREMGSHGRRRYLAKFTLERMLDETEAVYESALGRVFS